MKEKARGWVLGRRHNVEEKARGWVWGGRGHDVEEKARGWLLGGKWKEGHVPICFTFKERNGRKMNLIAAADKNWAIGLGNKLLVRIPEDMKFFQKTTAGKVVVMGRKTLESLPGGQPLKNRTNIVLTSNRGFQATGVKAVHSMEELLEELRQYRSEDIYVIGGESIYREMLGLCDVAYITKLDYEYEADVWFPNLDEEGDWEIVESSEEQTYFDLEYHFLKYVRKGKA